ncbi:MAG: DUF2924 domain-containing protein [Verrucomicrobiae bacterium]|nr:DUF2924 domain-containing protein [Verrucomicrobiae bacterium]
MKSQLAALRRMTPAELRDKYQVVFGEPTRSGNKEFLVKRIAWRIHALAEGGLSERAKRRAEELARDADLRTTIPRPPKSDATGRSVAVVPAPVSTNRRLPIPGTTLTREYRGRTIEVTVLPKGFEYEGEMYRSLSAVAKAVTGSHWNGYLFFGLTDGDAK